MNVVELIRKKRNNHELSADEISQFVIDYTADRIPDYQVAAFLMAVYFRGLSSDELTALLLAMVNSGQTLDLSALPGKKIDKHSTGGVGDKVSLHLAPAVAACGVVVPMMAGRGLGHTGGTIDKLEAIPGFDVNLSISKFHQVLERAGLAIIGQTADLAPADKRLYALRDVTATVESIPLIAASILSKKIAEGIDGLVMDVKVGNGAFMREVPDARMLASTIVALGRNAGKKVVALITAMHQPLGRYVGNGVEVMESIEILQGRGPADLRELTLALGAEMLLMANNVSDIGAGRDAILQVLENGKAYEKFLQVISLQGGTLPEKWPLPPSREVPFTGSSPAYVTSMQTEEIGLLGIHVGIGRQRKEDKVHPWAFIDCPKKMGDLVQPGEVLARFSLTGEAESSADQIAGRLHAAFKFSAELPEKAPLVWEVVR